MGLNLMSVNSLSTRKRACMFMPALLCGLSSAHADLAGAAVSAAGYCCTAVDPADLFTNVATGTVAVDFPEGTFFQTASFGSLFLVPVTINVELKQITLQWSGSGLFASGSFNGFHFEFSGASTPAITDVTVDLGEHTQTDRRQFHIRFRRRKRRRGVVWLRRPEGGSGYFDFERPCSAGVRDMGDDAGGLCGSGACRPSGCEAAIGSVRQRLKGPRVRRAGLVRSFLDGNDGCGPVLSMATIWFASAHGRVGRSARRRPARGPRAAMDEVERVAGKPAPVARRRRPAR